jgi:hypothetical protein
VEYRQDIAAPGSLAESAGKTPERDAGVLAAPYTHLPFSSHSCQMRTLDQLRNSIWHLASG